MPAAAAEIDCHDADLSRVHRSDESRAIRGARTDHRCIWKLNVGAREEVCGAAKCCDHAAKDLRRAAVGETRLSFGAALRGSRGKAAEPEHLGGERQYHFA